MSGTQQPINGFLVVDKPAGPTSMRVVSKVRHLAGRTKTGHAGTLDPLATGVLVMGLGRGTKFLQQVVATDKRYLTEVDLSIRTATDDLETPPEQIEVNQPPTQSEVEKALQAFLGETLQRPPIYSAVKINGRRAYQLARQDKPQEPAPRPVRVDEIRLLEWSWPVARIEVACGKGFYVRSLARDLGTALGTGGCCISIRRTAVGPFTCEMATALDELPDPLLQDHLLDIDDVLRTLTSAGS